MSYLPETGWQRILMLFFYFSLAFFLFHIAITRFLWCLLPLIFGYLTAVAVKKPVNRLNRTLHIPTRIAALLVLLTVMIFGIAVCLLIGSRIIKEMHTLYDFLSENGKELFRTMQKTAEKWLSFLKFGNLSTKVFSSGSEKLLSLLSDVIAKVTSFVPKFFIGMIILLFSAYYFTVDSQTISNYLLNPLGTRGKNTLRALRAEFLTTLICFLRAYSILFMLTYAQLAFLLTVFGFPFAFSTALLIALVDILPIFGSGSVLIPWSVISFIQHNSAQGMSLLIIYIIIFIIRQIAEPRLIGKLLGLHPLASLLSMFLGLAAYGVIGMFALPLIIIIAKGMQKRHQSTLLGENEIKTRLL